MNRRKFLVGTFGALAISCAPVDRKKIQKPTLRWSDRDYKGPLTATQFLTKCYNESAKGSGRNRAPKIIYASPTLFESFERECQFMPRFAYRDDEEYTGYREKPSPAFKCCKMYSHGALKGWHAIFSMTDDKLVQGDYYDLSYWQS